MESGNHLTDSTVEQLQEKQPRVKKEMIDWLKVVL